MTYLPDPPAEIVVDPTILDKVAVQYCTQCLEPAQWFFESGQLCNTHLFGV